MSVIDKFRVDPFFWVFAGLFVIFHFLDWATTVYSLSRGAREANVIMAVITANPYLFLLVEIVCVTAILISFWSLLHLETFNRDHPYFIRGACMITLFLAVAAVVNNTVQILGLP